MLSLTERVREIQRRLNVSFDEAEEILGEELG